MSLQEDKLRTQKKGSRCSEGQQREGRRDSPCQPGTEASGREQSRRHLDLGLPASRTVKEYVSVSRPPACGILDGSPSKLTHHSSCRQNISRTFFWKGLLITASFPHQVNHPSGFSDNKVFGVVLRKHVSLTVWFRRSLLNSEFETMACVLAADFCSVLGRAKRGCPVCCQTISLK